MTKLKGNETVAEAIHTMAGGNSKAEEVLDYISVESPEIDPDMKPADIGHMLLLDKIGIYGADISTLFDDKCNSNVSKLLLLLRATDLGKYSKSKLQESSSADSYRETTTKDEWRRLEILVNKDLPKFRLIEHAIANPYHWVYLYFKALWFNEDYRKFCNARRDNDLELQDQMREKYPHLADLHFFWRDVYGDTNSDDKYVADDERVAFDGWLCNNFHNIFDVKFDKFVIVREGEKITAKSGMSYFTIPAGTNKGLAFKLFAKDITALLEKLEEKISLRLLNLTKADWDKFDKLYLAERRLDVYHWRVSLGLGIKETIYRAYASESKCWGNFTKSVDRMFSQLISGEKMDITKIEMVVLIDQKNEIVKLKREGIAVVENVLHNKFPSAVR